MKKGEEDLNRVISRNIQRLMSQKDINNRELAKITGVVESTVGKWILGKSTPRMGVIEKMANYFGVQKSDILEDSLGSSSSSQSQTIPLVGEIAAGSPILAEQNIEDYITIDPRVKADFALKIKGDSMIEANILDGDIALIRKQPTLENGEIGAILLDTEATLKKAYKTTDGLLLQPCNSKYQPLITKEARIMGKLVAIFSNKEK